MHTLGNFLFRARLTRSGWVWALYTSIRFPLRSLPGLEGLAEIPGRFSSSSLPPLFVSGRFAAFSFLSPRPAAAVAA